MPNPFLKDPDPDGVIRYTKTELLTIARVVEATLPPGNMRTIHQAVIVFLEEALQE